MYILSFVVSAGYSSSLYCLWFTLGERSASNYPVNRLELCAAKLYARHPLDVLWQREGELDA
ncbi:hypothetical protein KSD_19570 [Ktedonobacter sp. SOSP1-85]|nr:hypothetical protein KSD_19570 [Ktedonobacter sp. SOSP1-85]